MKSLGPGLAVLVLLGPGCGGHAPVQEVGPAQILERAVRYIDGGDYLKAIEDLTKLTIDYPGLAYIDRVVFNLGRAYLGSHDHVLAETEFSRLLRDYPFSEYADDAAFLIGESYYQQRSKPPLDPTLAVKALDHFREFTTEFPASEFVPTARERIAGLEEHLAEKKLRTARHYDRRKRYASVVIYVQALLDEFPETPQVPEALLLLAEAREKQGDTGAACAALQRLRALSQRAVDDEILEKMESMSLRWGCAPGDSSARLSTGG